MILAATPRRSVLSLVTFTALVWGVGGLLSKTLIIRGVDAFAVTSLPFVVGALLARATLRVNPSREAIRDGLVLGAVNSAIPALCFNLGYETLPAGIVALLISSAPVITAALAHFTFDDEPFTRAKAFGLVLCVLGVAAIAGTPELSAGPKLRGVTLVLFGALVAGVTGVLSRKLALKHGSRAMLSSQLTGGALLPIIFALAVGRVLIPVGGFQAWELGMIVLIGTAGSYGGFRAIMAANETGTTGEVSVVSYLIPVIGVSGGVFFLDEEIGVSAVIGGLLIVAGVAAVNRATSAK